MTEMETHRLLSKIEDDEIVSRNLSRKSEAVSLNTKLTYNCSRVTMNVLKRHMGDLNWMIVFTNFRESEKK